MRFRPDATRLLLLAVCCLASMELSACRQLPTDAELAPASGSYRLVAVDGTPLAAALALGACAGTVATGEATLSPVQGSRVPTYIFLVAGDARCGGGQVAPHEFIRDIGEWRLRGTELVFSSDWTSARHTGRLEQGTDEDTLIHVDWEDRILTFVHLHQ